MGKSKHKTITIRERTKLNLTEIMIEEDIDSYNEVVTMLTDWYQTTNKDLNEYEKAVQIILAEIDK